jgi:hypothetical protein
MYGSEDSYHGKIAETLGQKLMQRRIRIKG